MDALEYKNVTPHIIEMAKSLKLAMVAEGVETEEQLDFLSHKLCDEVQGYYYFKPMPAGEVEKLLRAACVGSSEGRPLL